MIFVKNINILDIFLEKKKITINNLKESINKIFSIIIEKIIYFTDSIASKDYIILEFAFK